MWVRAGGPVLFRSIYGLGFGVSGLGFYVFLGFVVWGLGFYGFLGFCGFGFRVLEGCSRTVQKR